MGARGGRKPGGQHEVTESNAALGWHWSESWLVSDLILALSVLLCGSGNDGLFALIGYTSR